MARRAFYSFHYALDSWRASQVRNMGVVDGNRPVTDNDWETIKKGGDPAIKKWIDDQFWGKSVSIILIGEKTAGRKWIGYEIKRAWEFGKGVVGIYIHGLKDRDGNTSKKGRNPFDDFSIEGAPMSSIVKVYDPTAWLFSTYANIKDGLPDWIEEAIEIRDQYEK
jgi:hypothetical protein